MSKRTENLRSARFLCGLAVGACVVAMAGTVSAHAMNTGRPDKAPAPISDSVIESPNGFDVLVQGTVPARCQLGQGGDIDFGELGGGILVSAALGLECNVPFDLNVRSSNGGLAHLSRPGGEGGFSGRLGYDLGIEIPLLDPAPRVVSRTFQSQQLLAGATITSSDGIAAGGALLRFSTKNPEGNGLLAGEYSETILLTITPRM